MGRETGEAGALVGGAIGETVEVGGRVGRATGTTGAGVGERMGGEVAHALPSRHKPSSPQTEPGLQLEKQEIIKGVCQAGNSPSFERSLPIGIGRAAEVDARDGGTADGELALRRGLRLIDRILHALRPRAVLAADLSRAAVGVLRAASGELTHAGAGGRERGDSHGERQRGGYWSRHGRRCVAGHLAVQETNVARAHRISVAAISAGLTTPHASL